MAHCIIVIHSLVSCRKCFAPTWAVFWLCLPVQATRTGLSLRTLLLPAGTLILLTGTVHHAGRGEMDAYLTQAAFTLSTGAAKVLKLYRLDVTLSHSQNLIQNTMLLLNFMAQLTINKTQNNTNLF